MKILVATDKPFAKVAVDGIRKEIEPDPEELEALRRYEAGEPDYQPSISAENLKRELGL